MIEMLYKYYEKTSIHGDVWELFKVERVLINESSFITLNREELEKHLLGFRGYPNCFCEISIANNSKYSWKPMLFAPQKENKRKSFF